MNRLSVEYDLVFILDCLSPEERDKYKISEELSNYLAVNGIKQLQGKCKNKAMILDAFNYMCKIAETGVKFCVHIVSHGSEEGLWIEETDEDIYWAELKSVLQELNSKLENTLILNMSTCKGLHGVNIVNETMDSFPFFGLIGCYRDLHIWEAKVANEVFYNELLDGTDIKDIVVKIQDKLQERGTTDKAIYCISSQGFKAIKKLGKK